MAGQRIISRGWQRNNACGRCDVQWVDEGIDRWRSNGVWGVGRVKPVQVVSFNAEMRGKWGYPRGIVEIEESLVGTIKWRTWEKSWREEGQVLP
jgi:hypothetical protein